MRSQPLRPRFIILDLAGMRVAVDFDDQFPFWAAEIYDKRSEGVLAAEAQTIKLVVTQAPPQLALGGGEIAAKFFCPVENSWSSAFVCHYLPHPCPSPSKVHR